MLKDINNLKFDYDGISYEASVRVRFHHENDGADTDGGRTTPRIFIDEVIIKGVIDDRCIVTAPNDDMIDLIESTAGELIL